MKNQHRLKQTEWHKYVDNKMVVITFICRQCDEVTLNKLELGKMHEVNHKDGNLVNFFEQRRFICYQKNDCGLSDTSYKEVIATKLLLNFTNS